MERSTAAAFSTRLKTLREEIGATQEEMANALGVTRQSLSLYEQGKRSPDIEVLKAIHSVTGCSVNYLLGYSEAMRDEIYTKGIRLHEGGISESALISLVTCFGPEAKVLSAMFDESTSFWNVVKYAAVIFSDKNRGLPGTMFSSGYIEYKCYEEFACFLEELHAIRATMFSEDEQQEIEREGRIFIEEQERFLEEMEKELDEVETQRGQIEKRQLRDEHIQAERDKFAKFKLKMKNGQ